MADATSLQGWPVSDNSHFLDDRRREFALFRELAATAISSPARGVAMRPPSALSVRSLRFRRAPVGRSGDFLPPSPPAEKATARQDQLGLEESWLQPTTTRRVH